MTKTVIKPGYYEWLDITNHEGGMDSNIHTSVRDLTVQHYDDFSFVITIPHGSRFDVSAYVDTDGKYVLSIDSDDKDNAHEDLVFDNEIFAMNLHAGRGLTVDADHLAVDVIAGAMDGEDYFLQQHTLKHLRTGELYQPNIGLYGLVKQWEDEGSKDLGERAREEVRSILAVNEDIPLPEEAEREFERILNSAEKELT